MAMPSGGWKVLAFIGIMIALLMVMEVIHWVHVEAWHLVNPGATDSLKAW